MTLNATLTQTTLSWSDYAAARQERVNRFLLNHLKKLPALAPRLGDAMIHGTLIGGKRMRPLLVYATGELLGASPEQLDAAAAAIEAIHAYSLIHDDLPAMDDDALRRGQPTCHIQFDEATAILAGDALQTEAFGLLANAPGVSAENRLQLVQELATASGYCGMVGGQALDMAATGQAVSLDALITIHRHKTGALIRAAVRLGAMIGNAKPDVMNALTTYAECIGLAFQIQDDVLDEISDTQTLGKPQGSDREHAKSTYVSHLGVTGAQQRAAELIAEALHALEQIPYNTGLLAALARFIIERHH